MTESLHAPSCSRLCRISIRIQTATKPLKLRASATSGDPVGEVARDGGSEVDD